MFNRVCWLLGHALDKLHLPLAGAVLLFGRLWMPEWLHFAVVIAIVVLQLVLRTCPLNPIVVWLIHRQDPSYRHSSIVERMYARFGKVAALIILTGLIAGSILIAKLVGSI